MKYQVANQTSGICIISLIPESKIEEKLIHNKGEEDTFHFHYQTALEKHVSNDAVILKIIDSSQYPKKVIVKYAIAKGIAEY